MRRRRPGCSLSPPKRLFGLESDVAPGKSDVVQVAVAQFGQLAPFMLALPPNVERFAELRDQPSDQTARAGTGNSPVRPAEPCAGIDAGSQGLSARRPRRV